MLTDLWPTTGVQFASDEHAAILAGLVVKSAAGVPRAGVLPRGVAGLVTGRPDMRVNVLPMELVHVKEGARFAALTEAIDVAIPNPPAANTQYNIVCYVGSDQKLTGVASVSDFQVVAGTPSATPSDPALPDAAIPIARVAVPSTATATNSAGVVITPLHPFTAGSGGTVLFRSAAELTAWVAGPGQHAHDLASRVDYIRTSNSWLPLVDPVASIDPSTVALGSGMGLSAGSWITKQGSTIEVFLRLTRTAKLVGSGAEQLFTMPVGARPSLAAPVDVNVMSGVGRGFGWGFIESSGLMTVAAPFMDSTSVSGAVQIIVRGKYTL